MNMSEEMILMTVTGIDKKLDRLTELLEELVQLEQERALRESEKNGGC